ncbi:hypothetical protein [Sphingomonas swuensis]
MNVDTETNGSSSSSIGMYDPDLGKSECPGVVHRFVSKRAIFDLWFNVVVRRSNAPLWVGPNLASTSAIANIRIARPRGVTDPQASTGREFSEQIIDWPTPSSPSAYIVVKQDHLVAIYPWSRANPPGSMAWKTASASVRELVDWLRTPPNRRDNARVFELGGDRKE